jgi:hypothetical protein
MSQFDRAFSAEVLAHLEGLCQDFQATVNHKLADKIQEDHPELSHSQIVDAIGRFIRVDGDGSQDKAEHWFQFSARDIASAFEDQFEDEDDDDDFYDEDDNSESEKEQMRQSYDWSKSLEERRPDIYTRYIRWLSGDNCGYDEFVYFSSKGSQPGEEYSGENDPDDELIHFYGLSPEDAVPGYSNGEWVIVRY